eukprot:gene19186-24520_t
MGRIWAVMMVTTAFSSFFMKSFAPMLGQFGPIHILSVWTLYSLPRAIWYIRQGNVEGHLKTMRGLYFGLCLAGVMTFIPGVALKPDPFLDPVPNFSPNFSTNYAKESIRCAIYSPFSLLPRSRFSSQPVRLSWHPQPALWPLSNLSLRALKSRRA